MQIWRALHPFRPSTSCRCRAPQRDFRVYASFEGYDGDEALPRDFDVLGEFVVGRLMYPSKLTFSRNRLPGA